MVPAPTGDFSGDGIQDLMWENAPTGTTSEWLMSANGGLAATRRRREPRDRTLSPTGDFNGDGIDDLMWQNPLTGATSEWLMSAQGGLGGNPATRERRAWKVCASGKLDGGGIQDVMWENGLSGATSEWLMSAHGGLGGNPATPGAQGWNLVASGDFNGDGITDLMWQNPATGATSEWLMSAPAVSAATGDAGARMESGRERRFQRRRHRRPDVAERGDRRDQRMADVGQWRPRQRPIDAGGSGAPTAASSRELPRRSRPKGTAQPPTRRERSA